MNIPSPVNVSFSSVGAQDATLGEASLGPPLESFRNNEAVKHLQGYDEGNPNKQFLKSHAFDDVIARSIAQKAGIPMEDNSDEEESSGGIFLPILTIGATLGALYGVVANQLLGINLNSL